MRHYPPKITLTLVTAAFLLTVQAYLPGWRRYRFFDQSSVLRAFVPSGAANPASAATAPLAATSVKPSARRNTRPIEIEDPTDALRPFYRKLARRESGENLSLLILHYGESPVSADMVAADVRELLQSRFGNAGHGFCLPVKPWAWYDHRYVTINGSGWIVERVTNSAASDGLYGLGGVGYWGNPGAHAELTFDKPGHTQVEVSFLRRPDGGLFRVTSGGQPLGETDTAGPDTVEAFARFAVPAAANGVRLDVTSGTVRLFGWSLRRDRPGIVYSSLGLNGAFIDVIGRRFRSGHLEALWRHYQPDLIILNYGTNGLIGENMADEWFVGEVRHAFRRAKAAAPAGTPILVMSPMDKGWRDSTGEITTSEGYQQMIRLLHQVSAEEGLPFFDTFDAMGGPGTMGRWYNGEPRMVGSDFIHPTPGGGRTVAKLFVDALLRSYRKSRSGGGITQ